MRDSKRILSVLLIMCILCGMFSQVAMADEHTGLDVYDYDYELALERGYLTAEDDLPDGVSLEEGEIFVPAAVPDPGHAVAIARMREKRMQSSTRDFSNTCHEAVWEYYEWDYLGYVKGRTKVKLTWDLLIEEAVSSVFVDSIMDLYDIVMPWVVDVQSYVNLATDLYEIWYGKDSVDSYYKKYMWQAVEPEDYAYIHFHLYQVFDKDADDPTTRFLFETTDVQYGTDYMPGVISEP